MPMKPKKLCKRCGVVCDNTYCPTHTIEVVARRRKFFDDKRGSSSERGYDSRWQKLRLYKLAKDGLCERCETNGEVEKAVLVHHIKPISSGGEALDYDNLMSLCTRCHVDIHKELESGSGRRHQ